MRRTSAPNGSYVPRALPAIDWCSCEMYFLQGYQILGQYKHGWSEPLKISKVSEWKKTKEPTQVLKIFKESEMK